MKKILRNIIAVIFLIIGIIGGVIPILQGWVFVLTGFIILDFKKKSQYEEKILIIISKVKWGRGLANFWRNIVRRAKFWRIFFIKFRFRNV